MTIVTFSLAPYINCPILFFNFSPDFSSCSFFRKFNDLLLFSPFCSAIDEVLVEEVCIGNHFPIDFIIVFVEFFINIVFLFSGKVDFRDFLGDD